MPDNNELDLEILSRRIAEFSDKRDWEQYHNPKNLSMALAVEVSELMEIFQWLTLEQSEKANLSPEQFVSVKEEIADILIYAIRVSQMLDIDPLEAISAKLEKNNLKYPVEKAKGKATLD